MSDDPNQGSSESQTSVLKSIKILRESNNRDEILEAIEDLQMKARGNGINDCYCWI